jgi:hypothetical protein
MCDVNALPEHLMAKSPHSVGVWLDSALRYLYPHIRAGTMTSIRLICPPASGHDHVNTVPNIAAMTNAVMPIAYVVLSDMPRWTINVSAATSCQDDADEAVLRHNEERRGTTCNE